MKILISESQYNFLVKEINILGGVINENILSGFLKSLTKSFSKSAPKYTAKAANELANVIKINKPIYIERFGKASYEKVLSQFLSGSIDKNKFISIISSGGKPVPKLANFVSKFGIKFSQQEIKNLNDIVSWINNLPTTLINPLLDKKTVVRVATKFGNKDISVRFVTSQTAVKMYDDTMKNTYGFAIGENKIYFIVDNIKKMSKTDMEQLFYHEFAHIKDPSKISSSLMKKYNSLVPRYSDEYFSKSYYFHPRELVANTSKILNGLSVNTQRFMKTIGKQNTLKALDDLISWSKGTKKDFTDNMTKLLGSNEKYVKEHLDNLLKSPEDLRKLKAKIGQQSEYLKSQVNLSL
jgi:hypothetical protein